MKPGELTVLWRSDIIPGSPVAISNSLSPELKTQLTDAFQNKANVDYLKANGYFSQDCAFGGGGSWGYAPVDDAFYNSIRRVCAITENKNCTTE